MVMPTHANCHLGLTNSPQIHVHKRYSATMCHALYSQVTIRYFSTNLWAAPVATTTLLIHQRPRAASAQRQELCLRTPRCCLRHGTLGVSSATSAQPSAPRGPALEGSCIGRVLLLQRYPWAFLRHLPSHFQVLSISWGKGWELFQSPQARVGSGETTGRRECKREGSEDFGEFSISQCGHGETEPISHILKGCFNHFGHDHSLPCSYDCRISLNMDLLQAQVPLIGVQISAPQCQ
ncbi:hypothetical protein AV530_000180 [Patagioenas fasciata monilis]|uniref:Uncharacterized protein n=1 Tax=Patagioenas fasciata monilis TaxID=372326 RepID=A0A1V4K9D4_PATFA|nr:hypothetical protein AV530_000180 [Patagioenas fasciata monilis]